MKGARLLAAAALVAAVRAAPSPPWGRTIEVVDPTDGHSGSCPGQTCNLRAAWMTAGLGDTIVLATDPVMTEGPLVLPPTWGNATLNGTVTLTSPISRGAVVRGGGNAGNARFMSLSKFPYSPTRQVKLVIRNIEFTGFHFYTDSTSDADAPPGLIFCLSVRKEESYCDGPRTNRSPLESQRNMAKGGERGSPHPILGRNDTLFGNWSELRARPVLTIEGCLFRHNSYATPRNDFGYVGSMIVGDTGNWAEYATPWLITFSEFTNNTVSGNHSSVGVVFSAQRFDSGDNALMISNSRFTQNHQHAKSDSGILHDSAGPIIGNQGPISISGCSFEGNIVGSTRAVVSNGGAQNWRDLTNHVYIYDTSFIGNVANSQPAYPFAALVIGGWIVLERVSAILPPSVPPRATLSSNDQYLLECGVLSETGKPVELAGFQIFNRNPVYANLVNGSIPTGGQEGFADCAQAAPWLPCMRGNTCTNTLNPTGYVAGYTCS